MFKALMVRRLSKLRLLDDMPQSSVTTHTSSSSSPPEFLHSTFLLDDEFQPMSCDSTPHYPWYRALTEIIDTELAFVETLEMLRQVFSHVFHAGHKYTYPPILNLQAATESLLTLHSDIANALYLPMDTRHLAKDSTHLASVFRDRLPYFKLYANYCLAYKEVSSLLRMHQRRHSTELQQFVAAVCGAAKLLQVDIQSELIKPVQRLCRYPLLFAELLHHAPDQVQEDLATLVDETKAVAALVNDRVEAEQNNAKFLRLRRKLRLGFGCPEVLVPTRHYVAEAAVQVTSRLSLVPWTMWFSKHVMLVLLSDVLLVTKSMRHKRHNQVSKVISLSSVCLLEDAYDDDDGKIVLPRWWNPSRGFLLRYSKNEIATPKTYVVMCENEKQKVDLVSKFRQAQSMKIRNSMMTPPFAPLRSTRLPSTVSAV
ncbi:unnamed protein product [Aphanomyces euteiches]